MNQFYLCQKLAPLGVRALSTIALIGIAVAPAEANTIKLGNKTSNFIFDLDPIEDDMFLVTFSPKGIALISNVNQQFTPPFTATSSPYLIETLKPAEGIFELVTGLSSIDTIVPEFNYKLMEDVVFDFGNGSVVKFKADPDDPEGDQPIFVGEFDPTGNTPVSDDVVEFEIEITKAVNVTFDLKGIISNFFDGSMGENFLSGRRIIFGQANDPFEVDESQREVLVRKKTDEPAIMFGLLALGGLSLGMKRKKQSKK